MIKEVGVFQMKNIRKGVFIFIFISVSFLSGCWDVDEADRMNYVHGIGVDYEDGEIVIYLQLPNMGSLGSPDVTSDLEKSVVIAKGKGNNISSIIHDIYQSAQRKLYFGHSTYVILSEEALRQGLLIQAIDLMNRFPQTRYRINIFATKSNIEELLNVTTLFEQAAVLTRITDLENIYELSSLVKNISMRELIIQLDEPGFDGIIPAISLNKETWSESEQDIPAIKTIGVALIQPDKYCGFITGSDIHGLRWLQNSERNAVTVYKDDKPISEIVLVRPKHHISLASTEGEVTFEIKVHSRGIIIEIIEPITQREIIEQLENTIKEEIYQTFLAALELESDIYRLSEHLYRYELSKWREIEDNGTIPLTKDSIDVIVDIKLIDTSIEKMEPTIW